MQISISMSKETDAALDRLAALMFPGSNRKRAAVISNLIWNELRRREGETWKPAAEKEKK